MRYKRIVKISERLIRLLNRRGTWGMRGVWDDYTVMASGIDEGAISLRLHRVPTEAIRVAARKNYSYTGSESAAHKMMKRAALEWMQMEGCADADKEVRAFGHIIDVYSHAACWAIECGNTPPCRLMNLAEDISRPHRIMVFPFRENFEDEESARERTPPLCVVEFVISEDFCDWRASQRLERMRVASGALNLSAPASLTTPE